MRNPCSYLQKEVTAKQIILWCVLGLIAILPFDEGGNGYILQLIIHLLLLLCAMLWAVQTLRNGKLEFIFNRIDIFVLGFLVCTLVSSVFSEYAYTTILRLIKILSYTALFYLSRIVFPLEERRTFLLMAILGSAVFQSMWAWYFYLTQQTPILQGSFVNLNNFACFELFGIHIGLAFVLFFQPDPSEKKTFMQKIVIGGLVTCLVIAVLMAKSRGAVISLAGTGLFLSTLRKKKLGLVFVILLCVVIFIPTPWGSLFKRLQKREDPFAYQRFGIWKSSVRMAADHPVFGVGLGMFRFYGRVYNFPVENQIARYEKYPNAAHNDLLQIAAEVGFPGLVFFLGGIVFVGYYSFLRLRSAPPAWQSVAASAGILGILLQGMVSNVLHSPAIAMIAVLFTVILLDELQNYQRVPLNFSTSWLWYIGLLLVGIYILVPVIWYPFIAHIHYLKFWELREKKDFAGAIEHLETAIKYVPMHSRYHFDFGTLYLSSFRNSPDLDAFYGGYKSFTEAIRYNPREHEAYLKLAELHREMFYRKFRKTRIKKQAAYNALKEYQRASDYHPFNPFILVSMATLHFDIEEFEQAIALLERAVTLEPNFVGGYQLLGRMLPHLQRDQETEAALHQVRKIMEQYGTQSQGTQYVRLLLRSIP